MKINEQLLSALLAALEWIDAVPSDTVSPQCQDLTAMK